MPEGRDVVIETSLADGRAQLSVRDQGPVARGLDVFQLA
jgi:hypothetical protein